MAGRSNRIKLISFDLDETLVDTRGFEDEFWEEIIPRVISKKHKITLEEAKALTIKSYREVGRDVIEYFRPSYWFKIFKIDEDWLNLANKVRFKIKAFPDVKDALKKLSKKYKLIVITHSIRQSAKFKLDKANIKKFFVNFFSVIDDFKVVKRNERIYLSALKKLKIKPNELIHVGNDYKYDYLVTRKIGIRAILIDRDIKREGKDIIHDLREIESIL